MLKRIESAYIPFGVEHDPRIPPIGRLASARITAHGSGQHALDGEIELFEAGDELSKATDSRRTHLRLFRSEQIVVADDRAFRSSEDQEIINAIAADLDAQRETESKKSVESIAVLTIGLLLKGVVTGVGAKIGGEAWVKIRPKLASLFAKKRASPAQLLKLAIAAEVLGEERLIEVIVSDPQPQDLSAIRTEVLD